jgi:hypothetical protein
MTSAGIVIGVNAIHSVTNGTTPVVITPNALAGTVNVLKNLQVSNADSVTETVFLEQWDGTIARTIASGALSVGQVITVNSDGTIGIIGGTGSISGAEMLVNKDASSGYAGLTLFGINTKNDAGTVTSTLKNNNNTTQVYTLPDKTGTVALTSDIPTSIETTNYTFDSSTTDSDPGTGDFRFNASTRAAATFIYINKLTARSNDISEGIKAIVANDTVYIQDANNAGQAVRYKFTTTPVTSGNYFKLAVAIDVAPTGSELTNNADTLLVFRLSAFGGSGNSGTVTQVQGNGTVNGLTLTGNVTSSGNLTLGGNLTGTASGLTAGNVTNIPNLSGAITGNSTGVTTLTVNGTTSAALAAALTDETGTGGNVFAVSPNLTTPNLGTPSALNLSNAVSLNLTTGVSGVLPVANGGVDQTAWASWTPTFTNLTLGNGTAVSKYKAIGKTIFFEVLITLGTTSAMGTDPFMTLPVTGSAPLSTQFEIANGRIRDVGTTQYNLVVFQLTTTTMSMRNIASGGGYVSITATTPHTWAATDQILFQGFYEGA